MLMMPPALATKSGAQRIPRSCSSCGDRRPTRAGCWPRRPPRGSAAAAPWRGRARRPARTARRRRPRRAALRRARPRRAPSSSASARLAGVDVGEHERGAGGRRARARARRRRGRARSPRRCGRRGRRVPEHALAGDADRRLDAERGPRARVAGAAALEREPGDVARSARRSPSCRRPTCRRPRRSRSGRRAGRRCRRSRAARRAGVAVGRRRARGQHDHALAAAQRQPGDGRLERHRAREAQRVAHRRARVVVASTSGSRPATGRARSSARRRSCRARSAGPRRTSSSSWSRVSR